MALHTFYIPQNLDVEEMLLNHPPSFKLKKDKLYYLLNLPTLIAATNDDASIDEAGYVPINSDVIRKYIGRHYNLYLKYLTEEAEIWQVSRGFSRLLHFSRKYRYHPNFQTYLKAVDINLSKPLSKKLIVEDNYCLNGDVIDMNITSTIQPTFALSNKLPIKSSLTTPNNRIIFNYFMRQNMPLAYKWYNEKGLNIDYKLASRYNNKLWELREHNIIPKDIRWSKTLKKWQEKYPWTQYKASFYNIENLMRRQYKPYFDTNVFRMYSVLTSINKELRNAITWRGRGLVAIDISSCQPYLLYRLGEKDFWQENFNNSKLTLYNLPYSNNYINKIPISNLITLCNSLEGSQEIRNYGNIVCSGDFYKLMGAKFANENNADALTKDEVKRMMFIVLFSDNRFFGTIEAKPKRIFSEAFPDVYSVVKLVKKHGSEMLPNLLQRMESYLMYHKVLPVIQTAYPNLPVFTIHDSLVTLSGFESEVATILKEQFTLGLGYTPHCKIEEWLSKNLKEVLDNDFAKYKQIKQAA